MLYQLLACGLVCLVNFGLHAVITGIVIVATRHTANATDDLHVFARVTALLMVTMVALMFAHVAEIAVWAAYYAWHGIETAKATPFELAFENYTALGYGDIVPDAERRIVGPITATGLQDKIVPSEYFSLSALHYRVQYVEGGLTINVDDPQIELAELERAWIRTVRLSAESG